MLATNPAETRELGGFVGGYVLVAVTNGRVELLQSGKVSTLCQLWSCAQDSYPCCAADDDENNKDCRN